MDRAAPVKDHWNRLDIRLKVAMQFHKQKMRQWSIVYFALGLDCKIPILRALDCAGLCANVAARGMSTVFKPWLRCRCPACRQALEQLDVSCLLACPAAKDWPRLSTLDFLLEFDPRDVELVQDQTGAGLREVQLALYRHNGDIANAIMDLTPPLE